MAWLSVGTTNDELCNRMIELNVLRSENIIKAFRLTDRGDFVPQAFR